MSKAVLRVQDLKVHFPVTIGGWLNRDQRKLKAVDGISFELNPGDTLGIVGESGCGKSTLARAILGLTPANSGRVVWMGEDLTKLAPERMRQKRKELQIVFQDPFASLNPRMTIGDIVAEPLKTFYPAMARVQVAERVKGMLKLVGLSPNHINRYPHEFSGGQCQRVGIARALVLNPKLLVCDEPVSALDVSIQAQIVKLLKDLQNKLKLALIFIAHDLSVVKQISDRVMVMYMGRAVELSDRKQIYQTPLHPYTYSLIQAAPIPDPKIARAKQQELLSDDIPSPLNPPSGCVFRTRCPHAVERCSAEIPVLRRVNEGNRAACHLAEDLNLVIKQRLTS